MFYHSIIGVGAVVMVMSNAASLSSINNKQPGADASTDNVVVFLRERFQTLPTEDQRTANEHSAQEIARNKRRAEGRQGSNVKNNYTFEDYERLYLADRILSAVKQIYFKAISKPSANLTASIQGNVTTQLSTDSPHTLTTTTESSRTDRKMEEILAQLTNATVAQLQEALKGIEEAAEHTLDDLGISSVCCSLG